MPYQGSGPCIQELGIWDLVPATLVQVFGAVDACLVLGPLGLRVENQIQGFLGLIGFSVYGVEGCFGGGSGGEGLGVYRADRIQSLGTWRVYCEILVLSWGIGVSTVYRVEGLGLRTL